MSDQPTYEKVLLVLRQLIRAVDIRSRRLNFEYGLTGPQLLILRALLVQDGATPGELAEQVNLSQGTITGILDRLEKRGLIRRARDGEDRRRIRVRLEPAGQTVVSNAPPLMHEQFIEQFVKLAAWEQTQILASMQRLVDMMRVHAADEVEGVLERDLLAPDAAGGLGLTELAPPALPFKDGGGGAF